MVILWPAFNLAFELNLFQRASSSGAKWNLRAKADKVSPFFALISDFTRSGLS